MKPFRRLLTSIVAIASAATATALDIPTEPAAVPADTLYNPDVVYSPIPKNYEIAGIRVTGVPHTDDYIVIGYSGLSIGDRVDIPGSAITDAVRRFWRQGLYSKVQINVDKIAGDKVWLEIALQQQPRMSEMRFEGVKGGEKKDLNERLGMVSGQQLTPNIIAQAKKSSNSITPRRVSRTQA